MNNKIVHLQNLNFLFRCKKRMVVWVQFPKFCVLLLKKTNDHLGTGVKSRIPLQKSNDRLGRRIYQLIDFQISNPIKRIV